MKNKEDFINSIFDKVLQIYSTSNDKLTHNDIRGKSRNENVIIARCLLTNQLATKGFTVTTIAKAMNRSPQSIRQTLRKAKTYRRYSNLYRRLEESITTACDSITDK